MKFYNLIFVLVLLLLPARAFAEGDSITIVMVYRDDFSRESLRPRVTVMDTDSIVLHVYKDSSYNDYLKCWFTMARERVRDSYIVKAELKGYETSYETVTIRKEDRDFKEVTGLLMHRSATQLDEVAVEASKVLMINKGDTVIYNVTAFNLADGSMLDGLIRALPGATIEKGRISLNGQYVSKLLVNGRNFFHGDARIALENLPAYYVDRIKSYHEISPERRFLEGDSVKVDPLKDALVMDVELKRDYAEGWIANTEAAYGTQDRYLFHLFGMRYTRHSGIYLFGNLNNLNDTGIPDKEGNWNGNSTSEGVTKEKSVGIDFSLDTKKNKTLFDTSVKLKSRETDIENKTSTEQYFSTGDIFGRSRTSQESRQTDVTWGASYKYEGWKTGKKGYLDVVPELTYTSFRNSSIAQSASFLQHPGDSYIGASLDSIFSPIGSNRLTDMLINRREIFSRGKYSTWSGGGTISGAIPLKGRTQIMLTLKGHFLNKHASSMDTDDIHYGPHSTEQDVWQSRYTRMPNRQYDFTTGITSPSFRKGIFYGFVEYEFGRDYTSGERSLYRLDQLEGTSIEANGLDMLPVPTDFLQKVIDIRNSYETVTSTNKHTVRPQLSILGMRSSLFFSLPVRFYHRALTDWRNLQQKHYTDNSIVFEPNVEFQYLPSPENRISVSANYRQKPPYMGYLLEVRDDSDPLNISLGNSALNNEQQYTVSVQAFSRKSEKGRTQNLGFDYGTWKNSVSISKNYDPSTGISTFKPMNINGNWYVGTSYYMTTALDNAKHVFFTNQTNITYRNSVDYVSDQQERQDVKSKVRSLRLGESCKFDFNLKKVTISPKVRVEWTHAESPNLIFSTVNAFDFSYGVLLAVPIKYDIKFNTDLNVWSHRGYNDQSMNTNEVQWNANVTYACLKEKNLIFKLTAYDILGQVSNVRNVLNAQGRTETWYNTLPRYFMLHVTYLFTENPKINRTGKMAKDSCSRMRVYAPNMPTRHDRRQSIEAQFKEKKDFKLTILSPEQAQEGYKSLWKTFIKIVQTECRLNSPYFIFCEDDHVFTENYDLQFLMNNIMEADAMEADILSGGISWMKEPLQVRNHLFWVKGFNGMQFTIIFNRFYNKILSATRNGDDHVTDIYLSELSDSIFVMFPFISIQKEFGYSDVTVSNKENGYVSSLFYGAENRLRLLNKVKLYYTNLK